MPRETPLVNAVCHWLRRLRQCEFQAPTSRAAELPAVTVPATIFCHDRTPALAPSGDEEELHPLRLGVRQFSIGGFAPPPATRRLQQAASAAQWRSELAAPGGDVMRLDPPVALLAIVIVLQTGLVSTIRAAEDRELQPRVTLLIEQLASQNAAPKVKGDAKQGQDQYIRFDAGYDKALQIPVYLAAQQLLMEDEAAIDLLIAHGGDDRYSFSVNSYADRNVTVSEACLWIARRKIVAFEDELASISRDQTSVYPFYERDKGRSVPLSEWWTRHRQRGLVTLQLEAIDASIGYFEKADAKTALSTHAEAPKLPEETFHEGREENLRKLRAIRGCVEATGKPYLARELTGRRSHFVGLPWSWGRFNK